MILSIFLRFVSRESKPVAPPHPRREDCPSKRNIEKTEQLIPERRRDYGYEQTSGRRARYDRPIPRWEGPKESRPRGYLPAKDDPDTARDAVGETNKDPERNRPSHALKAKERRGGE